MKIEDFYDEPTPREKIIEKLRHNDQTMFKVYNSLTTVGLSHEQALSAINEMQNRGIYFREAVPDDRAVSTDGWRPGDPVYQQQPGWLICVCGVQVRWHPDLATTCPECSRALFDNLPAAFAAAKTEGRRAGWAEAVAALRDPVQLGTWSWATCGPAELDEAADYLETVAPAEKAPTAAHRAPQSDERGPGVHPGTPAPEETP